MITQEGYVDGSWELKIYIEDVQTEKTLRVKGDLHIGGVMFRLVEAIELKLNWSDHALWWPAKRQWLLHTRSTLDQCGVQADARLTFVRMHNTLRLQLPDLQMREMRVNFAKNVFSVVVQVCKELGVRHPEELSFMRPVSKDDLKRQRIDPTLPPRRPQSSYIEGDNHQQIANHRLSSNSDFGNPYMGGTLGQQGGWRTVPRTPCSPQSPGSPKFVNNPNNPGFFTLQHNNGGMGGMGCSSNLLSPASINSLAFEGAEESLLANSPSVSADEAFQTRGLMRLKTNMQRARVNGAWLDSSRSLMEQGVDPTDETTMLLLRFKFFNFYDLNPKYDSIRINQLFEQAKWSLIAEELECSEEEAMVFAALQLQVQLQANSESNRNGEGNGNGHNGDIDPDNEDAAEDEIDAALTQLQLSLEGGGEPSVATSPFALQSPPGFSPSNGELLQVPELADYIKYFKPRKFSLKNYKRYWMVLKETNLSVFNHHRDANGQPVEKFSLKDCEVHPDVNVSTKKFGIRLFVPIQQRKASARSAMQELWLRCESEDQYAKWMTACRLASKGKTMASRSLYETEVQTTLTFLRMQAPKPQPVLNVDSMPRMNPADFLPPRFSRRLKPRQIVQRIADAHASVREMSLVDAKLNYIRAWQRLPSFGVTYFVVRFLNSKREELFGVDSNRLTRVDINSGDTLHTWTYADMKSWHVNWEVENFILTLKQAKIALHPISANCKIVHEFVGGYVFLSMRTPEKNQQLNEAFFHKLTGGNALP